MQPSPSTHFALHLPEWRILRVLHDSTNASIFLARHCDTGIQAAIKRFKFDISRLSPGLLQDFFISVKALILSPAPGLVTLLETGSAGNHAYIIMEYIEGHTLRQHLSHHAPPPQQQALQWFEEITAALGRIHAMGLLHQDLKTSNIMIRQDHSLALLDFGMESRLLVEAGLLGEDEIYCTPYYTSPERIMGDPADESADLYALGVILYELLVGHKPYESSSLSELLKKHMLAPIPELPHNARAYQLLIDGLLAKFPENRLKCTDDVVRLLHKIKN